VEERDTRQVDAAAADEHAAALAIAGDAVRDAVAARGEVLHDVAAADRDIAAGDGQPGPLAGAACSDTARRALGDGIARATGAAITAEAALDEVVVQEVACQLHVAAADVQGASRGRAAGAACPAGTIVGIDRRAAGAAGAALAAVGRIRQEVVAAQLHAAAVDVESTAQGTATHAAGLAVTVAVAAAPTDGRRAPVGAVAAGPADHQVAGQ
jgi:hypothetical protein